MVLAQVKVILSQSRGSFTLEVKVGRDGLSETKMRSEWNMLLKTPNVSNALSFQVNDNFKLLHSTFFPIVRK